MKNQENIVFITHIFHLDNRGDSNAFEIQINEFYVIEWNFNDQSMIHNTVHNG